MPTTYSNLTALVIAHWGLVGTATAGKPNYRSQNPWQALEHYMELDRGNARTFFNDHGATPVRIDVGGSVWRIDLATIPTPHGESIGGFAELLLERLVLQNSTPMLGDYLCVSYADHGGIGRWECVIR